MLTEYKNHVKQRRQEGLPPLPLNAKQVTSLVELLKQPRNHDSQLLLALFINRIPPGVDKATYVKAKFLEEVAKRTITCDAITPVYATRLLGTMIGGYNVQPLINLLDISATAGAAEAALSKILLVYDAYHDVVANIVNNKNAKSVMQSWADAEWFKAKPPLPRSITVTVIDDAEYAVSEN